MPRAKHCSMSFTHIVTPDVYNNISAQVSTPPCNWGNPEAGGRGVVKLSAQTNAADPGQFRASHSSLKCLFCRDCKIGSETSTLQ